MKVGIIQSNYIPWRGYFDFIDDVDLFIFFDDVQYTRHDWRNRNKIKNANGTMWVTVPVIFNMDKPVLIKNARIDYKSNWIKKHIENIRQSYSRAPFSKKYLDEFSEILQNRYETISELNIALIQWVMEKLSISTKIRPSSDFNIDGFKTCKIINILKQAGAKTYLSGPAGKNYLEPKKFKEEKINLEYKSYEYKEYPQLYGKFEPYVTVLDLLFNCGEKSCEYLKSLKPNERVH